VIVLHRIKYDISQMNGVIFPASPNWYCSRVSDCNESGKFVFAARNKLHVADFSDGDLTFSAGSSWETHVERCCSLSLCQVDGFFNLCCTAGEDDQVRVWDIETRSLLHEYDGHRVSQESEKRFEGFSFCDEPAALHDSYITAFFVMLERFFNEPDLDPLLEGRTSAAEQKYIRETAPF
jgi:hypothetical protein